MGEGYPQMALGGREDREEEAKKGPAGGGEPGNE